MSFKSINVLYLFVMVHCINIGLHAYFWFNIFQFHRELKIAEKNKRKAAEDNENRMMSIASGQSSLPDQNQATTQDSRAVTVTW